MVTWDIFSHQKYYQRAKLILGGSHLTVRGGDTHFFMLFWENSDKSNTILQEPGKNINNDYEDQLY